MDPKLIKSFKTSQSLNEAVASRLIEEFQKPGLILLPVGSTFEQGIYPLVNEYFSYEEYKLLDAKTKDELYAAKHHKISPDLLLSHLDELVNEKKKTFSSQLKKSLEHVIVQLKEEFYEIDIDDLSAFDRFIKRGGGPRVIVLGLGSNPEIAHVAFIAEEFLNTVSTKIKLSAAVAAKHNCKEAITIGTDVFQSGNLEKIIVAVKGKNKAKALVNSFIDPDTGLGHLIANHASKLEIYADEAALSEA